MYKGAFRAMSPLTKVVWRKITSAQAALHVSLHLYNQLAFSRVSADTATASRTQEPTRLDTYAI
ncbi:hypothetical protein PHYBLDRAFT_153458 [Phycomyces blakesleeanus NRRL 1555(-)]|uniref:Uncharacterized protein n=1 Tax=Phycomyces blakesleeanus (strain ATCC 8743b / DSM 1359 / FGSC 10004 / NBRC 33097 / NRRL 1555) TaxID=763407 RepID=A0A162T103_PHYB8|nr:hypothetical protein PHYBLDRAFT_153458 [Phycomyces blakesleeanus NRRL 1555(-)]OAD65372.1 hypothetical protein PHYBLDRAFT_153458 [Phycomyces blakesleeanus NRRL 1555(-)]|eukprot:XP_018283412.1 hypothetical protein PHYBLDRAFT_153458 [Phycomyces blakesleeanus NRRL 1555(-)]